MGHLLLLMQITNNDKLEKSKTKFRKNTRQVALFVSTMSLKLCAEVGSPTCQNFNNHADIQIMRKNLMLFDPLCH
jgi:hypothetical protein